MDDVLIMAGGFGERLWPASSKENPKQFMLSTANTSFLQEAMLRALYVKPTGYIVVITRADIARACLEQIAPYAEVANDCKEDEPPSRRARLVLLVEPESRHTSAAIMSGVCLCRLLAAHRASHGAIQPACDGQLTNRRTSCQVRGRGTLVLTSDHIIRPVSSFASDCERAERAAKDGHIVCFAIPPTEPATGYGYIKTGCAVEGEDGIRYIEKFVEKPPLETAKEYLASGNYFWNSGMFAFLSDTLLDQMRELTPDVSAAYDAVLSGNPPPFTYKNGIMVVDDWTELKTAYSAVPKIAIDKSVAEKTNCAVSVMAHFEWHDVGSWDSFVQLCEPQNNKMMAEINGSGNFVYSDIPVALCGVSDLVVVVKNGALLVMKKGSSALVRDAMHRIVSG